MFDFSKEDALFAAEQFCFGLNQWSQLFTASRDVAENIDDVFQNKSGNIHQYSEKTAQELKASLFYELIDTVFDFADKGEWDGNNVFMEKDRSIIEDAVNYYLTELCMFDEVFRKANEQNFIFFGLNAGNEYFDVEINGRNILGILQGVVDGAFARWKLVQRDALRLEDISVLSGLNIKTVRNAAASKGTDGLIGVKNNYVDYEEAVRWLMNKKRFSGPYFMGEEISYEHYESLNQFKYHCESLLTRTQQSLEDALNLIGINKEESKALKMILRSKVDENTHLVTPAVLKLFGECVEVSDLHTFVREGSKIIANSVAVFTSEKLF